MFTVSRVEVFSAPRLAIQQRGQEAARDEEQGPQEFFLDGHPTACGIGAGGSLALSPLVIGAKADNPKYFSELERLV